MFLFYFLQSCSHNPAFEGVPFKKYANPPQAGFDTEKLDALTSFIQENAETTGMLVLQDGKTVYEYGDIEQISYIASCRKSVLSMLYGKHIENGTIDLQQDIGSLGIEEKDGLLPKEKEATVNDIITSRSGVFHVASNGGYDINNFRERGSVEHGSYFVYNNWDFNVAGHILEQKTGNTVYQELETQLAKPLGFQDWNIKNQRRSGSKKKSQYKAYHIYVSTRDMAKMGQLMLNEGTWNGQQLISKDWLKKTITTVTPREILNERYGPKGLDGVQMSYGYMWWLVENYKDIKAFEGAYSAMGYGGQYITVFPKLRMVVAHKTKLNLLTQIGLKKGGTAGYTYWGILEKLVEARSNP